MNYTMVTGKLTIQPPDIVITELSITQENSPCKKYTITANGEQTEGYSEQFKFHFHCKFQRSDDLNELIDIDFDFFQDNPIEYGSFTWVEAVEKWLFPELGIEL